MAIEGRFITETPNAERNPPPPNLGLVAEDVVEGVRIALATVDRDPLPRLNGREYRNHIKALDAATIVLVRFLEDLPKVEFTPVFAICDQDVQTHRLGRLLDGVYALFQGPVRLVAGARYPINYWNQHQPPEESLARDVLPGLSYEKQLYIGYAPPHIGDMNGYAISLNHFLNLNDKAIINLDAVRTDELEIPRAP